MTGSKSNAHSIPIRTVQYGCRHCFPDLDRYTTADTGNCPSSWADTWGLATPHRGTTAYQDIMDNDPSTNSYMNFFPSTTKEEDLDRQWLENILKSRKNYFRRNRDLCIICMVGLYLIAMVDAYVDASLSHFDITPDLSLQWSPALIQDSRGVRPSVGLNWALTF